MTGAFEGIKTDCKKDIFVDGLLGKRGLGMKVAEMAFKLDVDVSDYNAAIKQKLDNMPRYAMVTLTNRDIGAPINSKVLESCIYDILLSGLLQHRI
jgi:hypothetical protein